MKSNYIFQKFLIEIRYKSKPELLDKLGGITSQISQNPLTHWQIQNGNRVDIFNEDKNVLGFIGISNLGFQVINPDTEEYFINQSTKYLKNVFNQIKSVDLLRIGVRRTILFKTEDLNETISKLKTNFGNSKLEADFSKNGFKLFDIAYPLEFKYGKFEIKTNTGPFHEEETESLLREHNLSDKQAEGVLIDIDNVFIKNKVGANWDLIKKIILEQNDVSNNLENLLVSKVLE